MVPAGGAWVVPGLGCVCIGGLSVVFRWSRGDIWVLRWRSLGIFCC